MSEQRKPSQPSHGEGPSRHGGKHQHGWSSDVDETHQQDNPSAHRSFHPEEYAPDSGSGRKVSKEEKTGVPADTAKSTSRRGEDLAGRSKEKGLHDTGSKGHSGRPSGTKDASAGTGVDPQDPKGGPRQG
ncbi:hypothetical protein ACFVXE_23710 [Streptomyces sp. NPDC058231]|uniref:hypothetical protein n=1 Tax=Streptomyces sp. NPDC058231 TaxID=3346392 RepID=UPI0036EE842E